MCWWQISVYFRYSRILWRHQSTVTYQIQRSRNARVTKHFDDVTIFWSIENCSNKPLWLTHSESALNIWIFGLKLAQFHGRKFFYLNGKKFASKLRFWHKKLNCGFFHARKKTHFISCQNFKRFYIEEESDQYRFPKKYFYKKILKFG